MSRQKSLDDLLEKWQAILRVQDWDIQARHARWHEIKDTGLAHAEYRANFMDALLLVRDPADNSADDMAWAWAGDVDQELSIVHELLHVKMSPIGLTVTDDVERFVESLARVLVALERRR